jgi:hypothetical protein
MTFSAQPLQIWRRFIICEPKSLLPVNKPLSCLPWPKTGKIEIKINDNFTPCVGKTAILVALLINGYLIFFSGKGLSTRTDIMFVIYIYLKYICYIFIT